MVLAPPDRLELMTTDGGSMATPFDRRVQRAAGQLGREIAEVERLPFDLSALDADGSLACFVPETHSLDDGVVLPVNVLVEALLDPIGAPRDGVSILGGEPFAQPVGLAALLRCLKARRVHTVVYTGYTLEVLARRAEPAIRAALELTDLLIDGPFVAALADGAGEWRGSRNQRFISHPALALVG